jgi:hypothetical protein
MFLGVNQLVSMFVMFSFEGEQCNEMRSFDQLTEDCCTSSLILIRLAGEGGTWVLLKTVWIEFLVMH